MDEYIKREAVKHGMIKYGFTAPDMTVTEFVEDELPAADVVEVVKCKNCKNRYLWLFCGYFGDEDYCSKGAKMDKEVLNK